MSSPPITDTTLPRSILRTAVLRHIEARDNTAVEAIVTETLAEFDYTESCPANDKELANMARYIQHTPDANYYVIEDQSSGKIVGCGGFEPLKMNTTSERICEMIKFYVTPDYRDKGLGGQLLQQALHDATDYGYDTMYYEVTPRLFSKSLFERLGFFFVEDKLGNNGHFHPEINIFVVKALHDQSPHKHA